MKCTEIRRKFVFVRSEMLLRHNELGPLHYISLEICDINMRSVSSHYDDIIVIKKTRKTYTNFFLRFLAQHNGVEATFTQLKKMRGNNEKRNKFLLLSCVVSDPTQRSRNLLHLSLVLLHIGGWQFKSHSKKQKFVTLSSVQVTQNCLEPFRYRRVEQKLPSTHIPEPKNNLWKITF